MIMLIRPFWYIYLGDVGSPKDAGSGFTFVFLLFDFPFWLMAVLVGFFRAPEAYDKGTRCLHRFLLLLWRR